MKKITIIIICLVASLFCSGIAYASWAIEGDVIVNASTADLAVDIVRATANYSSRGIDFTNDDITIGSNKKTANVNIDDIYPGSKTQFEIIVKNTGTMPVSLEMIIQKFSDIISTKTGNNLGTDLSLLKYMLISYQVDLLDSNSHITESLSKETASVKSEISKIYEDNSLAAIEPDQTIKILIDVEMDSNAGNETMNKSFSFVISPLFSQH